MENSIQPTELAQRLRNGEIITLIDVRTPTEYEQVHVQSARNIPLHELDPDVIRAKGSTSPIYVICQKGGRGRQACQKLLAAGMTNVVNVDAGTEGCIAAGLPVVYGRKTISLERQVRIVAGSLVLLGATLGWVVHPLFYCLSALIGAGLMFAGITDTCGMGMLLARMPWNQTKDGSCCRTTVAGHR